MKRIILAIAVALVVLGYGGLALKSAVNTTEKIELQKVQLKDNITDLKELQLKYDNLNFELEHTDRTNTKKIKQLQEQKQKLEDEKKRLEAELVAKRERQERANQAAEVAANALTGTQAAHAAGNYTPSGNKDSWLAASGIPKSEWWAVDFIVSRESGWDPCAYNPSKSDCNANPTSACGLAQSLPCGKQSKYGHWTDPVANLKWQHEYVKGRYGGYPQAVAFWKSNHWY